LSTGCSLMDSNHSEGIFLIFHGTLSNLSFASERERRLSAERKAPKRDSNELMTSASVDRWTVSDGRVAEATAKVPRTRDHRARLRTAFFCVCFATTFSRERTTKKVNCLTTVYNYSRAWREDKVSRESARR
jgi:hypothetical protein